jgi:hypothetical protein
MGRQATDVSPIETVRRTNGALVRGRNVSGRLDERKVSNQVSLILPHFVIISFLFANSIYLNYRNTYKMKSLDYLSNFFH